MPFAPVSRLFADLRRGLVIAALAGPAAAQDGRDPGELSYIFSASITSDYVANGISQSGGNPSFQPFFELDWRGFYGGLAVSYVRLDRDRTEFDVYLGHRRRLANAVFFDLSYRRFLLDDSGDCCGEAKARVIFPVGEHVGADALLVADPQTLDSLNRRARVLWDATDRLNLTAALGETSGNDNRYWNVGATYALRDRLAMALRYEGADAGDPGLVVTLGWSTVSNDIARLFLNPFQ